MASAHVPPQEPVFLGFLLLFFYIVGIFKDIVTSQMGGLAHIHAQ